MRAERANPKSCKDDDIIAQGKRSAALGCGRRMIPSFFLPVLGASGAQNRKGKRGWLAQSYPQSMKTGHNKRAALDAWKPRCFHSVRDLPGAPVAGRELLPTCERLGLAFTPYFPPAMGLLTGKSRRGEREPLARR